VINPNKNHRQRNLRRIGGNDGVAYEIWGNTPDGKIIAKVTNLQSCPNDITVRAGNRLWALCFTNKIFHH
jgi:hypothetical protein